MEWPDLQVSLGNRQANYRHQLERLCLLWDQACSTRQQKCRGLSSTARRTYARHRETSFHAEAAATEPSPCVVRSESLFVARFTRANRPKKVWSRTSIRCMRSANPAKPLSEAKSTKAGSRCRQSMTT